MHVILIALIIVLKSIMLYMSHELLEKFIFSIRYCTKKSAYLSLYSSLGINTAPFREERTVKIKGEIPFICFSE